MDESNVFTKKHVEEATAAHRTLLDELNLPPAVKRYIQDNARFLQVSFVLVVGAICVWNFYGHYSETRNDQAAQQLTQAMLMADVDQKAAALAQVSADFSSTGSALWGQMILARDYVGQKEYGKAIPLLQELHKDVRRDNPLYPLLQQVTGVAYELSGDLDMALQFYGTLSSLPGFVSLGYIESGRVFELKGQSGQAKDAYEKAHTSKELKADLRAWLQAKIDSL